MLFDIDRQGFRQPPTALPETVGASSPADLEARRCARGCDNEVQIARRMAAARDEMGRTREFDYRALNRGSRQALSAVQALLVATRTPTARMPRWGWDRKAGGR